MWAAVGIHPLYAKEYTDECEQRIIKAMEHRKVVAWGEIGLDYHDFGSQSGYAEPALQKKVFARQIALAVAAKKVSHHFAVELTVLAHYHSY